jgi:hypothetical protein
MKPLRSIPIILALSSTTAFADGAKTSNDEPKTSDKSRAMDDTASRIQAHVMPMIAGIESADKAAAVVYELSGGNQLLQSDVQTAVDLARQALTLAHDRAVALDKLAGLSDNARVEIARAQMKLQEARTTVQKIDQKVAKKQARVARNHAEMLREQAKDVHDDLVEAEKAIEQVARAYDIPTDLEFRG